MRAFVTGVKNGKSCVVKTFKPDFAASGLTVSDWFDMPVNPPPSRPQATGDFLDAEIPNGALRCRAVRMAANWTYPSMHCTDTIDFYAILEGRIELILDDGSHIFEKGDCLIVAGVTHAWKAGPEGCTLSAIVIGTPSPR